MPAVKKQTIKELQARIRELKQDVNRLNKSYVEKSESARRHREYIEGKFNWFVDLLAEGESPNLAWLIKDIKDALVRFK